MAAARLAAVFGLGFGDCGKGRFTDLLCRRTGAHTVVRYNGGGQAGHTVVLPDGRCHTFSQFGSGSFLPGVRTVLARTVVLHPTALGVEAARLHALGLPDAPDRLLIDARCRVTTPYHQALGRLRELARGEGAHGTCGAGFGETVRQDLEAPELTLRAGELATPAVIRDRLECLRQRFAGCLPEAIRGPAAEAERRIFLDPEVPRRWMAWIADLMPRLRIQSEDPLAERLALEGTVIFEGAQGMLLDEALGFHPHTTWSSVGPQAAAALAQEAGHRGGLLRFGALRAYLTRHGAGPLPTEDPGLDGLQEPHNQAEGWQGRFRRGHPDGVLLDYASRAAGAMDGILLSHADAVGPDLPLRWCEAYESSGSSPDAGLCRADARGRIVGLVPSSRLDLDRQARLTGLLRRAVPVWGGTIRRPEDLMRRMEASAGAPILLASQGPAVGMETWRGDLGL